MRKTYKQDSGLSLFLTWAALAVGVAWLLGAFEPDHHVVKLADVRPPPIPAYQEPLTRVQTYYRLNKTTGRLTPMVFFDTTDIRGDIVTQLTDCREFYVRRKGGTDTREFPTSATNAYRQACHQLANEYRQALAKH